MANAAQTATTDLRDHAKRVVTGTDREVSPPSTDMDKRALDAAISSFVPPAGFVKKVVKRVTVPVLSMKIDETNPRPLTVYCEIIEPVKVSTISGEESLTAGGRKRGAVASKMEDAEICLVRSISGEVKQLVVGTVLSMELAKGYPEHGYVGRWFEIVKYPKAPGRAYSLYEVTEIEPPYAEGALGGGASK